MFPASMVDVDKLSYATWYPGNAYYSNTNPFMAISKSLW